ncbi:hypothetical protein X727_31255 [Mesorhizobium sp. L103C119B0]|nr:hypothetical protein X727_31255 [Mesorhizobium sp. L103C119B0]
MYRMQFKFAVSLGASCSVAYQIRRYFGQETAFPFDWLITPFASLIQLIENDLQSFVEPAHLAPYQNYFSLLNTNHLVLHHHDVPRENGRIVPDWAAHVEQVRDKYEFLGQRWREMMTDPEPVLFVRHQGRAHLTNPGAESIPVLKANGLSNLIKEKRQGRPFQIIFASAIDPEDTRPLTSEAFRFDDVRYTDQEEWPDPSDWWRGASADWTRVFKVVAGSVNQGRQILNERT